MTRCKGCGIELQDRAEIFPGYVKDINDEYCERCFRIINYNEDVLELDMDNDELLKKINEMNNFTFFLCDFLTLNREIISLYEKVNNPKIFVITKVDTVPKNIKFNSLIERVKKVYNLKDVIIFSKESGYGKNEILSLIDKNKECLFVGPSNGGKSSLINYLFNQELIESNFKNTTQDFINLDIDNYKIIDAPGFSMGMDSYKLKKALNPKTMNVKTDYILLIDKYSIAFSKEVNLTLFFPKDIEIKTIKSKIYEDKRADIKGATDIIFDGLGFIYLNDECELFVNNEVETRKSIVGGI